MIGDCIVNISLMFANTCTASRIDSKAEVVVGYSQIAVAVDRQNPANLTQDLNHRIE